MELIDLATEPSMYKLMMRIAIKYKITYFLTNQNKDLKPHYSRSLTN